MLKLLSGAMMLAIGLSGAAQARDLTFASWGGNYQDAQRVAFFKPFAESKSISFAEDTYLGGLADIKTMAETGQVKWDLVMVERADLILGCDEGLFEKLDWDKLGTKDLLPTAVHPCGAGAVVVSYGIGYNKSTGKAPQTWADFFDTKTWPGKRGLRAGPKMNMELALIADGVPFTEVYKVLATPEGVDRAFAKLDTIKADLQFWDAGAQPVDWLSTGNVVMSSAYNGRISNAVADGKPLGFVWANNIYGMDSWAIPARAPNKALAMEFIAFANSPEPQAEFPKHIPYGTSNVKAAELMAPDLRATLPAGANMDTALFMDDVFWADHFDQISVRWNNWATQ